MGSLDRVSSSQFRPGPVSGVVDVRGVNPNVSLSNTSLHKKFLKIYKAVYDGPTWFGISLCSPKVYVFKTCPHGGATER